jgi:hypothetical protein
VDIILTIWASVAAIFVLPWITFRLCRSMPRWSYRLLLCLMLVCAPLILFDVYLNHWYALQRSPSTAYLTTLVGWGIPISALLAAGSFLSLFPDWAVDRILHGLGSFRFGKTYYDPNQRY